MTGENVAYALIIAMLLVVAGVVYTLTIGLELSILTPVLLFFGNVIAIMGGALATIMTLQRKTDGDKGGAAERGKDGKFTKKGKG